MKKVLLTLAFLLLSSVAQAQTGYTLEWDYDAPLTTVNQGTHVITFNGTALTAPVTCVARTAPQVQSTCKVALPALQSTNTINIRLNTGSNYVDATVTGITPASVPKLPANFKVGATITITIQ